MGFTKHFYIIFGTNLLTGGQPKLLFSCLFQCFEEKEYQTESKRNETFGRVIFGTEAIQETWSRRQGSFEEATRQGGVPYPLGAPPPSWAPRGSPDRLLSPIYIHIPRKHPGAPRNLIPPSQPSVSVRSHLGAFASTLSEGESTMKGIYIISKASPMSCE